jgi:plastocyanin domain-containing protein
MPIGFGCSKRAKRKGERKMLIANIIGLLLIALIVWWFWIFKSEAVTSESDEIVIKVANGTYDPSRISLTAGQSSTIRFLRTDESPCSSVVVFAGLDISEDLPVGEIKEIALPALSPGEYPFTCQMQMYRGDLVVKENSNE